MEKNEKRCFFKKGSERTSSFPINDFEKRKDENKQFSKREELFFFKNKRGSNSRERERKILTDELF